MDPMIKNSFFTILIYWNDNRIHLGLTKKLIFFLLSIFMKTISTCHLVVDDTMDGKDNLEE